MSSGKSTLITEYLHFNKTVDFTPPPIEVSHEGLAFEFIDSVFALEHQGNVYNFYELDAPTITKWHQFLSVADAVVLVYNLNPRVMYGSHEKFGKHIFEHSKQGANLIFALNNFEGDLEKAKAELAENYDIASKDRSIDIVTIQKGKPFFDDIYGSRTEIKKDELEHLYNTVMGRLANK